MSKKVLKDIKRRASDYAVDTLYLKLKLVQLLIKKGWSPDPRLVFKQGAADAMTWISKNGVSVVITIDDDEWIVGYPSDYEDGDAGEEMEVEDAIELLKKEKV